MPIDVLAVQLAFYEFLRQIGIAFCIVFVVFLLIALARGWMDRGR